MSTAPSICTGTHTGPTMPHVCYKGLSVDSPWDAPVAVFVVRPAGDRHEVVFTPTGEVVASSASRIIADIEANRRLGLS